MKRILILTSLMACCIAFPQHLPFMLPQNGRIIGGEDANIEEVPYQVAMLKLEISWCGGSLIRSDVVLTAAHCIELPENISHYSFRAGSVNNLDGGQLLTADSFVCHENYNTTTVDNDIAVILLKKSFTLGSTVAVINIPLQDQKLYDGTIGVTSGWGNIDNNDGLPKNLQKVEIPVVNREICSKKYFDFTNMLTVTPRMFCAGLLETGGKDTCGGDSGGPFAVNGELIGVTSWGHPICALPGFPGVYSRVASFTNWINKTIANMDLVRSSRKIQPDMSSEFLIQD